MEWGVEGWVNQAKELGEKEKADNSQIYLPVQEQALWRSVLSHFTLTCKNTSLSCVSYPMTHKPPKAETTLCAFFTLLKGKSYFHSLISAYSAPKRYRKHAASQLQTQETQLFQNDGPWCRTTYWLLLPPGVGPWTDICAGHLFGTKAWDTLPTTTPRLSGNEISKVVPKYLALTSFVYIIEKI